VKEEKRLIGSEGGSALAICSLNRWKWDLLNFTNSKYKKQHGKAIFSDKD